MNAFFLISMLLLVFVLAFVVLASVMIAGVMDKQRGESRAERWEPTAADLYEATRPNIGREYKISVANTPAESGRGLPHSKTLARMSERL